MSRVLDITARCMQKSHLTLSGPVSILSLENVTSSNCFPPIWLRSNGTNKTHREDLGKRHAFSELAMVEMDFVISLDVGAALYPSHAVLKMWYVVVERTKLSPTLVLCKMLRFEKHSWNVKHYCHDSKNIHIYLLAHCFMLGCIKIHTKQFCLHGGFFGGRELSKTAHIEFGKK